MRLLIACGAVAMAVLIGCSGGGASLDSCSAALVVVQNRTGDTLDVQFDNRASNRLDDAQGQCIDIAETGMHEIEFTVPGEEETIRQVDLAEGEVLIIEVTLEGDTLEFAETQDTCTAGQPNTSCLEDPASANP